MEDQLRFDRLPAFRQDRRLRRRLFHMLLIVQMFALLPLASCSSSQRVSQNSANVQPLLLTLAQEEPDLTPRLIVQVNGDSTALLETVSALGGTVIQELGLINSLVIDLPAANIQKLADNPSVRWISFDAPVQSSDESGGEVVLNEDFSMGASGSMRAVNWRWYEIGEEDGMEEGDVLLTTFFGGQQEGLRIQNGAKGIETQVELTLSSQATMQMSFRRKSFAENDGIRVEVSKDGGGSWELIDRIVGPITDDSILINTYNLTPWVGSNITLRLISEAGFSEAARFYVDFVQIRHTPFEPERNYVINLPLVTVPPPDTVEEAEIRAAGSVMRVRDEFSTVSYANNNGNTSWATNWIEHDPSGVAGPAGSDYVGVVGGTLFFHYALRDNERASRSVNIADAQSATLSFDWWTWGLDRNEELALLISTSPNGPFTVLTKFGGTKSGNYSVDITGYRSSDTTIRFANLNQNWEWLEFGFVDNVQIEWTVGTNTTTPIESTADCTDCIDKSNLVNVYPQTVGASELWNENVKKQGNGIAIAVVDSGIAHHPDLTDRRGKSRILARVDFTTGGAVDDFYGHGTHVAGIAAGNGKQSYGSFIGVAPAASLVDVKVTDDNGVGTTSGVVAGLQWVFENKDLYGIRVVNMSLNSTVAESYHNSALNAAVEMLWFSGVVVVVSSGNNGDNDDAGVIYPPANDPYVITVGASDDKWTVNTGDDWLAPYTAYGYTNDGYMKPEIVVPGTYIIAPLASDDANLAVRHPDHVLKVANDAYYFLMSGTSMASGAAAGAAALLLSADPKLTPDQVKYRLMSTGQPFSARMGSTSCKLTVFDDALIDGWENQSWNVKLAAAPFAHDGNSATAVTYTQAGAAFSLRSLHWINPANIQEIRFWAYGAPTGNVLHVYTEDKDANGAASLPVYLYVPANQWTEMIVPISSLGNISAIKRINIQDAMGTPHTTLYIDNLRLTGDCTKNTRYLNLRAAVRSTDTQLANQDNMPHMLLAKMAMIAYWASQNGDDKIDWSSVNWNSVNWNSVNWNSVNWNSVNWNSVNWNSVNWNSVNWNSVNWNSVNWNSVNWNSVNWNSVNWNSVERNSTEFD